MTEIRFPQMRAEVRAALSALADEAQQRRWGRYDEAADYYDDLTQNVNMLEDCQIIPDPSRAAPEVLHPGEVPSLAPVVQILLALIDDHGEHPDSEYVADPRWPALMEAAGAALREMQANDAT